MKKWLLAALVLVFAGIGWSLVSHGRGSEQAVDPAPAQPVRGSFAAEGSAGASGASEVVREEEVAAPRSVVAPGVGALRVVVRGTVSTREGARVGHAYSLDFAAPPEGVHVDVWQGPEDPDAFGVVLTTLSTDARGIATIDALRPGQWRVTVRSAAGRDRTKTVDVPAGAMREVEFDLGVRSLRGRVVDADGAPVAGATVRAGLRGSRLQDPDRQLRAVATSGPDGTFHCVVVRGEDLIAAGKAGFAPSWAHPVDQVGDGEVVLRLGRERGAIAVTIAAPHGVALPPLCVHVRSTRTEAGREHDGALREPPLAQIAEAVAPGRFVVRDLAPGTYNVRAQHPGRMESKLVKVVAGEIAAVEMAITPGALVRGTVRDADGRTRSRVHVQMRRPGGSFSPAVTDAGGVFQFAGIEPGEATLVAGDVASRATSAEVSVSVPTQGECVIDLELAASVPLRVRIVDAAGTEFDACSILARQGAREVHAAHEAGGRFAFWGLAPEAATISVTMLDWHRRPHGEPVLVHELSAVDVATRLEFTLPAAATATGAIAGRVVDEHGRPVADAIVDVEGEVPAPPGCSVDSIGRFRIEGLRSGRRRLEIRADDHVERSVDVAVRADATTELGDLAIGRAGTLRLQFLRADGTPWRDYPPTPQLVLPDGTPHRGAFEVVDGALFAYELAPGRYTVQSRNDDELRFAPQPVDVRAGATAQTTVIVELGRRIVVFVTPPQGMELGDATITAVDSAQRVLAAAPTRREGRHGYATLVLPIGPCTLRIASSTGLTHEERFVVAHELGGVDQVRLTPKAPK